MRKPFDAVLRQRMARAIDRVCPPWLRDQRDDLVQMASMRLLRSHEPPPYGNALLGRIAYTVVVDEIRRMRRRNEVGMTPSMPGRIVDSKDISPETRARGVELGEVLVECLNTLIPSRRAPVILYLQDHSIPEIAEHLDCSPASARNRTYRGLEDLRRELARRGLSP